MQRFLEFEIEMAAFLFGFANLALKLSKIKRQISHRKMRYPHFSYSSVLVRLRVQVFIEKNVAEDHGRRRHRSLRRSI